MERIGRGGRVGRLGMGVDCRFDVRGLTKEEFHFPDERS